MLRVGLNFEMFEAEDYKFDVLTIISNPTRKIMSGLRMELFMAAATSNNAEDALMPFPSCFFDSATKTKSFDKLLEHIKVIPALKSLHLYEDNHTGAPELPQVTWKLLYWILTNPLTIEPVTMKPDTLEKWEQMTGLHLGIARARSLRTFLFEVVNPNPNPEFVKGKAEYGSTYAFHGSKLENFHSIVHRGLKMALNRRSAYGRGSYLSTQLNVSFAYTDPEWKQSWTNGDFGPYLRCVAICEIVKYPGLPTHYIDEPGVGASAAGSSGEAKPSFYVVDKDEFIQLTHLILFVTTFGADST